MTYNSRYMGYNGPMTHANLVDEERSHCVPLDRTMSDYSVSGDHTNVVILLKILRSNIKWRTITA